MLPTSLLADGVAWAEPPEPPGDGWYIAFLRADAVKRAKAAAEDDA